jgi:pyruvate kinase
MRTQLHITLGPASYKKQILAELLATEIAGVRINMSHADKDELCVLLRPVADVAPHIRIGADLRGRKLRIGPLPSGATRLKKGDEFRLIPMEGEEMGKVDAASVNYPNMENYLSRDTVIVLDDGGVHLSVCDLTKNGIVCVVRKEGTITERSGVNLPGKALDLPALTNKDYEDLDFLAHCPLDFIYLSFTETQKDIELLREALKTRNMRTSIVAKVETAAAVDNIDGILQSADAICLARGDLGVEIPLPKLPFVQRHIIKAAHKAKKSVFLAGELMNSLVTRHTPFRAELTDIAVAVEQGVSGFVASDETAIGVDPMNAVHWFQACIEEAEKQTERH